MRNLIIDGMLSGTGVRDADAGGYADPHEVGLSADLVATIEQWLLEYADAHYHQFVDGAKNERLDQEGIAITRRAREELPGTAFEYYSNASLRRITVT